jgi:hypothetical protein
MLSNWESVIIVTMAEIIITTDDLSNINIEYGDGACMVARSERRTVRNSTASGVILACLWLATVLPTDA